jgi:hypothetical protein
MLYQYLYAIKMLATLLKNHFMGKAIGLLFLVVGIILLIGNVSGWWPTFPLAGFITMGLGSLIIKIAGDD